ncbi:hypothetical protein AYI68_g4489 [Smittium mucronatum]|uniref:Uncharacterized protein n=1 Tax=Smittium mucronatum TaxID=133383 RepID=A0A1R0GWY1_9FUNG|nr:hypothetical protein AYI68_g4489 [Smittium mucronatum]
MIGFQHSACSDNPSLDRKTRDVSGKECGFKLDSWASHSAATRAARVSSFREIINGFPSDNLSSRESSFTTYPSGISPTVAVFQNRLSPFGSSFFSFIAKPQKSVPENKLLIF